VKRKVYVIAGAVVIFAVAAVLAITLWPSSGPSPDGPFGPSGSTTQDECIPIPGRVITYGSETVTNDGSSDATIQQIGYVNPHDLQVLQTFAIPVHNHLTYAGLWGYPPRWMLAERTSVIPPGHQYELVIVTRLTGQQSHADAVLVSYTENGTQYLLRTITALYVRQQPGPFPNCPP
jgi:hypothetical protein